MSLPDPVPASIAAALHSGIRTCGFPMLVPISSEFIRRYDSLFDKRTASLKKIRRFNLREKNLKYKGDSKILRFTWTLSCPLQTRRHAVSPRALIVGLRSCQSPARDVAEFFLNICVTECDRYCVAGFGDCVGSPDSTILLSAADSID